MHVDPAAAAAAGPRFAMTPGSAKLMKDGGPCDAAEKPLEALGAAPAGRDVGVVAQTGVNRLGKSSFANEAFGTTFQTGDTATTVTKDIDAAAGKHTDDDGAAAAAPKWPVAVLDSQGTDDVRGEEKADAKILLMACLLATVVLHHVPTSLNASAVVALASAAELAAALLAGTAGAGAVFGDLVFVVRNSTLVTTAAAVHQAVFVDPTPNAALVAARATLAKCFRSVRVVLVPPPAAASPLRWGDAAAAAIADVRRLVVTLLAAAPARPGGTHASGAALHGYAQALLRQVAASDAVDLAGARASFAAAFVAKAVAGAFAGLADRLRAAVLAAAAAHPLSLLKAREAVDAAVTAAAVSARAAAAPMAPFVPAAIDAAVAAAAAEARTAGEKLVSDVAAPKCIAAVVAAAKAFAERSLPAPAAGAAEPSLAGADAELSRLGDAGGVRAAPAHAAALADAWKGARAAVLAAWNVAKAAKDREAAAAALADRTVTKTETETKPKVVVSSVTTPIYTEDVIGKKRHGFHYKNIYGRVHTGNRTEVTWREETREKRTMQSGRVEYGPWIPREWAEG